MFVVKQGQVTAVQSPFGPKAGGRVEEGFYDRAVEIPEELKKNGNKSLERIPLPSAFRLVYVYEPDAE